MLMTTSLLILASSLSLGLGVPIEEELEEENMRLNVFLMTLHCCDFQLLDPQNAIETPKCPITEPEKDEEEDEDEDEDDGFRMQQPCRVECLLTEHKLMEDFEVKEEETKKLLLEKSPADAKHAMTSALDLCFNAHDRDNGKGDFCKSGAESLFACLTSHLLTNCPQSLWNYDGPGCRESIKFVEQAKAMAKANA